MEVEDRDTRQRVIFPPIPFALSRSRGSSHEPGLRSVATSSTRTDQDRSGRERHAAADYLLPITVRPEFVEGLFAWSKDSRAFRRAQRERKERRREERGRSASRIRSTRADTQRGPSRVNCASALTNAFEERSLR